MADFNNKVNIKTLSSDYDKNSILPKVNLGLNQV